MKSGQLRSSRPAHQFGKRDRRLKRKRGKEEKKNKKERRMPRVRRERTVSGENAAY
jgi:hypothetical protein